MRREEKKSMKHIDYCFGYHQKKKSLPSIISIYPNIDFEDKTYTYQANALSLLLKAADKLNVTSIRKNNRIHVYYSTQKDKEMIYLNVPISFLSFSS